MKFWSSVAYQVTEVPPPKPESATHAVPGAVWNQWSLEGAWVVDDARESQQTLPETSSDVLQESEVDKKHMFCNHLFSRVSLVWCPITWCLKISQAISTSAQIDDSPFLQIKTHCETFQNNPKPPPGNLDLSECPSQCVQRSLVPRHPGMQSQLIPGPCPQCYHLGRLQTRS